MTRPRCLSIVILAIALFWSGSLIAQEDWELEAIEAILSDGDFEVGTIIYEGEMGPAIVLGNVLAFENFMVHPMASQRMIDLFLENALPFATCYEAAELTDYENLVVVAFKPADSEVWSIVTQHFDSNEELATCSGEAVLMVLNDVVDMIEGQGETHDRFWGAEGRLRVPIRYGE